MLIMHERSESLKLFEIAKTLIPGDVQKSRHPRNFADNYPVFMNRGKGSHVWDVDGNEYIDWLLSYGPIVLGHRNKQVDKSVTGEMKKGFVFDLTPPLQLELAKKLIKFIPCAEKVILTTTGSGATTAAVRIARIYTGREIIIRWGYHGWHDWCLEKTPGIPRSTTKAVKTFKYNDLNSLSKVLDENKGKVACIIMMPFEFVPPQDGFLEGVRDLANDHGTVLIFDEVRSWPRMGLGGAQGYFGVTPDLTAISKGIANGYPISAVVGKADFMEAAKETTISATYFPSTIGIAAALKTLQILEEKNAIQHIWNIAERLTNGLKELITVKKVRAAVIGLPQMPLLIFGDENNYKHHWKNWIYKKGDPGTPEDIKLMNAFYSETIKRGVFFHPRHHWYSCLSHSIKDVEKTLKASEEALDIAVKNV
jgi:glutamate-1-semialdehyde aminotransferase